VHVCIYSWYLPSSHRSNNSRNTRLHPFPYFLSTQEEARVPVYLVPNSYNEGASRIPPLLSTHGTTGGPYLLIGFRNTK